MTLQALSAGDVAVTGIFSTTPSIAEHDLVVLNRQVGGEDPVSPATAAREWLAAHGY